LQNFEGKRCPVRRRKEGRKKEGRKKEGNRIM